MLLFFLRLFLRVLLLFMAIAFVTLLERKLLAYRQRRVGPTKMLLKGIMQPIIDGVKLLHKNLIKPLNSPKDLFFLSPLILIIGIVIFSACFSSIPFHRQLWCRRLLLLLILRLGVYRRLLIGFTRASKYSFIGGIRRCIQRVRYEVRLAIIIFSIIIINRHISFSLWSRALFYFVLPLWFIRLVAETNRAPFDLAEGERELVRGLNIELSRAVLAYVLVGEYGFVIILSWLTAIIFFWNLTFLFITITLTTLFIRSVFPRYRYDKLIALCWTKILPLALFWCRICLCVPSL